MFSPNKDQLKRRMVRAINNVEFKLRLNVKSPLCIRKNKRGGKRRFKALSPANLPRPKISDNMLPLLNDKPSADKVVKKHKLNLSQQCKKFLMNYQKIRNMTSSKPIRKCKSGNTPALSQTITPCEEPRRLFSEERASRPLMALTDDEVKE